MKSTSNHDNSWAVDLLETVASRADSLAEGTKFLEAATALLNAENERIQAKRDDDRSGFLMNDIYKASKQMGIDPDQLRNLKAMTTPQLDAYAEQLYQQSKNRPFKHLSAA